MSTKPPANWQAAFVTPPLTILAMRGAIPDHCFKRSALRSFSYIIRHLIVIAAIYWTATSLENCIPEAFPDPAISLMRFAIWALYGFWAGLFATGLWVIAHDCGHQAFSESRTINYTVGWILHSSLGVPFHSWRITHKRHHLYTNHMTKDEVFVPPDDDANDLPWSGGLEDVFGDSPMFTVAMMFGAGVVGWFAYLTTNATGQPAYPAGTNHFMPSSALFTKKNRRQVIVSNIGVLFWLAAIVFSVSNYGFMNVLSLYVVPYLWVNHWLVLITFLQHTDPLLPHYRGESSLARGALATFDRSLLGGLGKVMGWIAGLATNGITETHVLHHVASEIPHYNAWEASATLKAFLASHGIDRNGGSAGWFEVYRVLTACKSVGGESNVVWYGKRKGSR